MKPWCKAILSIDANLEQAIQTLNEASLRIALIVSNGNKLQGTLTDGDVRRALLKYLPMDTPVSQVMNKNPKTAKETWTESHIIGLMEQYELLHLPVVDIEGRVVGLFNLHDILKKPRYNNPVFLMAGGFGTRLKPLTNNCPKPMLRVANKPLLEQILLKFVEAGFYRFYISIHYKPDVIRNYFGDGDKWGVSIKYVCEEEPLGTAGALGMLPRHEINQPMFMMNGDLLTSLNLHSFLEFHESHNGIATMCVREYEHQVPYGVITSAGTKIKSIIEKPVHRFFVNAGIYLLDPTIIKSVAPNEHIDMPTLLERKISEGKHVNMFPIHEYWLDIGQIDDFQKAQDQLNLADSLK